MVEKYIFNRKEVEAIAWRAYLVGKTKYKNLDFAEWLSMEFSLTDKSMECGKNENRNKSGRKVKGIDN